VSTKQFLALVLVVVFAAQIPSGADDYRYQGVETRNLITVVNNHQTRIENLQAKLAQLAAKLDGDSGVGSVDYADELDNGTAAVTSTTTVHGLIGH
jgi:hypothetical protein